LHRLAGLARLILFDKRGTGLSDPVLDVPTPQQRTDDLLGVLDAAASRRPCCSGCAEAGRSASASRPRTRTGPPG
jgi:hypothetical protein